MQNFTAEEYERFKLMQRRMNIGLLVLITAILVMACYVAGFQFRDGELICDDKTGECWTAPATQAALDIP